MITRCAETDLQEILDFIGNDYHRCLYLYLDLLQYGFGSPHVFVWRQNCDDGSIAAVWLRYHSGMHVYAPNGYADVGEAMSFVSSERPALLCGVPEALAPLKVPMLEDGYEYQEGTVCKYANPSGDIQRIDFRKAESRGDFMRIGEMLSADPSYGTSYTATELADQLQNRSRLGQGMSYVVERDGSIVTHVCVAAEHGGISLLSGAVTDPSWRRERLCSRLFFSVVDELEKAGRESYSFYYNHVAAGMHRKIGFVDCGQWGRLSIKSDD